MIDNSSEAIAKLRLINVAAGVVHLVQAVVVLLLSNGRSLNVTAAFGNGPPGQPSGPLVIEKLFSYRIGVGVFVFLLLSAVFHFIVASPWGFSHYRSELLAKQNRFRWVEYSMSATIMIVLIAGTVGITDVAALLADRVGKRLHDLLRMVDGDEERSGPAGQLGTLSIREFRRSVSLDLHRYLCCRCVGIGQQ